MGNSVGKAKKKHKGELGAAELSQPGQPIVTLASDRKSPLESSEVSDEVVLHWHPCTHDDKGYDIEMWDLGLQEWVHITTSEEPLCTLSNILSGILYRFRVTALTSEGGSSFPSDPSEPFVIDIPGVQIAPYWIQTPPTIVSLTVNQPLQLSASALGTPAPNFHWYKDDEELFIRPNLTIEMTPDGSQLTILNAESDDGGTYTCTAVNTVGKCSWETTVDLKAKPAFTLPPGLKKPIAFQIDELMSLKVPLIAVPEPTLLLEKLDPENDNAVLNSFAQNDTENTEVKLSFRHNYAVIKMECAQKWHTGRWRLTATNPIGSAEVGLHFHVRSDPDPPREAPEVEEISPEGIVTLSWLANVEDEEIYGDIQYQVEYNRETWDIWLKGCLTKQLSCTLGDLFPGSYYRFRIRSVCKTGISQPSVPTERIFIGRPEEDEVFGLPGGNYPKDGKNHFHYGIKSSKRFSSLGQDLGSHQSNPEPQIPHQLQPSSHQVNVKKDRQYSLERDVYYIGNRREEVVTYEAAGIGKKLGASASHRGLNAQEQAVYKRSLGDLCNQLIRASQTSLAATEERQKQRMASSFGKDYGSGAPLKRYKSIEDASAKERAQIVSSLTQLCVRLKSVSRESSLAPYSSQTSLASHHGQNRGPNALYKYPDSSTEPEMNPEEAKKALHASTERISSLQNRMKNSSERDEELEEPEEMEGPLGTSSPVFPQKLELAPGGETTETEIETETETEEEADKIGLSLEEQTKQRQNLLLSRPYFLQPPPGKHKNEYNPSLSTISSHTMMASEPKSPNLSLTSAASATLVASEATLLGQPSIETDESRTLQHNDTFDNSEMSDISFDHTIGE